MIDGVAESYKKVIHPKTEVSLIIETLKVLNLQVLRS